MCERYRNFPLFQITRSFILIVFKYWLSGSCLVLQCDRCNADTRALSLKFHVCSILLFLYGFIYFEDILTAALFQCLSCGSFGSYDRYSLTFYYIYPNDFHVDVFLLYVGSQFDSRPFDGVVPWMGHILPAQGAVRP